MQRDNVRGVKTSGVLLKVFKEVTRKNLVEECGAILELIDVHLFHCGTNELLAAVLSCLPNFVVFGASLVDGFGLLHRACCCILGNLVIPEAKAFGNGECAAFVVSHVGELCLHNPYDRIKSINPVIGDGLQDVKEHFLLYQVIFLVLYCWFLGGKGTPSMFTPVL